MSEGPDKGSFYTRLVALAALISSGLYCGIVVARNPGPDDIRDFTIIVPIVYAASVFALALFAAIRSPSGVVQQHVIRGCLSALLAFAFMSFQFLSQPQHWGDGTFHWGTLYVGLLITGPILSGLFAAAHALYAALYARRRQCRPVA